MIVKIARHVFHSFKEAYKFGSFVHPISYPFAPKSARVFPADKNRAEKQLTNPLYFAKLNKHSQG